MGFYCASSKDFSRDTRLSKSSVTAKIEVNTSGSKYYFLSTSLHPYGANYYFLSNLRAFTSPHPPASSLS